MTTLHQFKPGATGKFDVTVESDGAERRQFRRHDLEQQGIAIDRILGLPDGTISFYEPGFARAIMSASPGGGA